MKLLTDNRNVLCEELCNFVVENLVSTAGYPANSVWTAAYYMLPWQRQKDERVEL